MTKHPSVKPELGVSDSQVSTLETIGAFSLASQFEECSYKSDAIRGSIAKSLGKKPTSASENKLEILLQTLKTKAADLMNYFGIDDTDSLKKFIRGSLASLKKEEITIDDIEEYFADTVINIARTQLGNPYDTNAIGQDGGGLDAWKKKGKVMLLNNFTGENYETTERPFVCTDLIVFCVEQMGIKHRISKTGRKYFWRRISEIEESLKKNRNFKVFVYNEPISYQEKKLPKGFTCMRGDIITISDADSSSRHVGIVTEVDSSGIPVKVIHSSGYRGVVETPFLNSEEKVDYRGKKRYDGFLYGNAIISQVIRPNVQVMIEGVNTVSEGKIPPLKTLKT